MIDSMVGAEGFEPPTLCSQSRCATRLRYAPTSSSLSHRLRISPQIEPNKPCDPGPNSAWKSPSNTHVNRSNGSRTSAIRMMHRPPRKNQLCMYVFAAHPRFQPAGRSSGGWPARQYRTYRQGSESAPTTTSIATLATIRATVTYDTPRTHAATMMMQEAMPPIRSPMPGTNPTMPSRPNRIDVPGILIKSSSRCDSRSRFSSSNAFPPRFRRGDSTSGFAVNGHHTPQRCLRIAH